MDCHPCPDNSVKVLSAILRAGSFMYLKLQSYYVAKASFKFAVSPLASASKCWDFRLMPQYLAPHFTDRGRHDNTQKASLSPKESRFYVSLTTQMAE